MLYHLPSHISDTPIRAPIISAKFHRSRRGIRRDILRQAGGRWRMAIDRSKKARGMQQQFPHTHSLSDPSIVLMSESKILWRRIRFSESRAAPPDPAARKFQDIMMINLPRSGGGILWPGWPNGRHESITSGYLPFGEDGGRTKDLYLVACMRL